MPGATYAYDHRGAGWLCRVHGGFEMWHTCGGGEGEPLGYCDSWDGEYVGGHLGKDGKTLYGGSPTCEFDPNRWDEEEE